MFWNYGHSLSISCVYIPECVECDCFSENDLEILVPGPCKKLALFLFAFEVGTLNPPTSCIFATFLYLGKMNLQNNC